MKIDRTTSSASPVSETRPRAGVAQPKTGDAAQVHLSPLAAQLQTSGDAPAFDANKVSQIRQAIAEGRFTINASAIADRLIDSASELVRSQKQG